MALIYYDKRTFTAAVSTTAQAGYPASNLLNESLRRPWRATGVGAEDVTLTAPAALGVHSLCLHDVNFASCTVRKSADGVAFNTVGVLTTYPDRHGRRRGRITINDAVVKALQIQIGAGATTDGLAFWRGGAAYPMGSSHQVPADLNFPLNEEPVDPAIGKEIVNGLLAEAGTGERFSRVETVWHREATESLQTLITKAKAAVVWFDAGTADYPEQQWPLYLLLRSPARESFDRFRFSRPTLQFTERV
jgi:hypothetical protein